MTSRPFDERFAPWSGRSLPGARGPLLASPFYVALAWGARMSPINP
jgi:hypothetical protein